MSRFLCAHFEPLGDAANLKGVLTPMQVNKPGIGLIFRAEEHFCQFSCITNPAQGRTRFAAEPDAGVTTRQEFLARFVARGAIAWLAAGFGALKVLATPRTRFAAKRTWLFATLRASVSGYKKVFQATAIRNHGEIPASGDGQGKRKQEHRLVDKLKADKTAVTSKV